MVKSSPRIPQLQLLYSHSKITKKKFIKTTMTPQRRFISSSNSLSSPPQLSPEFLLKRTNTDDDPDSLFSDSKKIRKTINEDQSPTTEFTVSPTLEGYLPPPLPPPPSPEFLRRTVSVSSCNVTTSKEIMKAETKTVSTTGEWMIVKCNCECGKDCTNLINKADNKCHKLV